MNKEYENTNIGICLPLKDVMPGPKIFLLSVLPISVFSSTLLPSIVGIIILSLPWCNIKFSIKKLFIYLAFALSAGVLALSITFLFHSFSHQSLSLSARMAATVLLLLLCAVRYESTISVLDLLHLASRVGGARFIAIPLLSAFRFSDLLRASWREAVIGLTARGILKGNVSAIRLSWAGPKALANIFNIFFRRIDNLSLAFDLRFGSKDPIRIYRTHTNLLLDIIVIVFGIVFLFWAIWS